MVAMLLIALMLCAPACAFQTQTGARSGATRPTALYYAQLTPRQLQFWEDVDGEMDHALLFF